MNWSCPQCRREGPEDSRCNRCDRDLVPPRPSEPVWRRGLAEARQALKQARSTK